jgi:ATP/maltotriose-dependent transcriptional regulator MalT
MNLRKAKMSNLLPSSDQYLLLETKLYIPQAHDSVVVRKRLLDSLNEGIKHKLTLIAAPVGFGKTTLLGLWCNGSNFEKVWVSLDNSDNELTQFWTYIVGGLGHIVPELAESTMYLLNGSRPVQIELVIKSLINTLTKLSDTVVLILDDYHVIEDQTVQQSIIFLLEHMPPNLHLVIGSRTEPPLPLARLRARRQLTELSAKDLKFTSAETVDFLNQVMGLNLSSDDVAALETRTEGWIAGLQLAALSIQKQKNIPDFIRRFSGDNRFIVDYLASEILDRQPDHIRDFLVQTSILDYIHAPLCNAITGRNDSQAILETLDTANLFIVRLDNKRRWYRYHQLFAEFLRDHAAQSLGEDELADLHRHASDWYIRNDSLTEAADHALKAGDIQRLTTIIEPVIRLTFARQESQKLLKWLDVLPETVVESKPMLSLAYGWALFIVGHLDAVEPYMQNIERHLQLEGTDWARLAPESDQLPKPSNFQNIVGQMTTIRAVVACYQGQSSKAIDLSRQALSILPQDNIMLHSFNANNIVLNLNSQSGSREDLLAVTQTYTAAVKEGEQSGDKQATIFAMSKVAEFQTLQGHITEAYKTYETVCQRIESLSEDSVSVADKAYIGMGEIFYEWNQLEKAQEYLLRGVQLAEQRQDLHELIMGYVHLARSWLAQGDPSSAADAIHRAEQIAYDVNVVWITDQTMACKLQYWLQTQQEDKAFQWAANCDLKIGDEIGYRRDALYTMLARIHLTQQKPRQALEILDWLGSIANRMGLLRSLIEFDILRAIAFHQLSDQDHMIAALLSALEQAATQGYVRPFLDAGKPVAELLRQVALKGEYVEFIGQLLKAIGSNQAASSTAQKSVDALSGRELEVLRLIAVGLSNKAVAQELVLSVGTIKAHVHRIHSKLGVRNRTEAVKRARDLGFLS